MEVGNSEGNSVRSEAEISLDRAAGALTIAGFLSSGAGLLMLGLAAYLGLHLILPEVDRSFLPEVPFIRFSDLKSQESFALISLLFGMIFLAGGGKLSILGVAARCRLAYDLVFIGSIFLILNFPLGTIFGIYSTSILSKKSVKALFKSVDELPTNSAHCTTSSSDAKS